MKSWKKLYCGNSVSSDGDFMDPEGNIRSQHINGGGYRACCLYCNGRRVYVQTHIVVAEMFVGYVGRQHMVHFKNRDSHDCRAENLEIVLRHAVDTPQYALLAERAVQVRQSNEPAEVLAKQLKVSVESIKRLRAGEAFARC